MILDALISPISDVITRLIDRVIPDKVQQDAAKLALLQEQGRMDLEQLKIQISAIVSESQSLDPWTSRARPTFLYVMYLMFLLVIVGSIVGIWYPIQVFQASKNMAALFAAIPQSIVELFGVGYLGYTGARTWEKTKRK
jgi:hypothetical protein